MNHEEQDDLWELLGKARAPKERPFFAAKVLRAIQEDSSREAGLTATLSVWWQSLRRHWTVAAATAAAVAVAIVLAFGPQHHAKKTSVAETKTAPASSTDPLTALVAASESSDDLASSLDSLMATQDNSIWLADAPSSF